MRTNRPLLMAILAGTTLASVGCNTSPGKPGPVPEVVRPDQVLDFATLYKANCVACHGTDREPGAAISLTNPVFLAVAGQSNLSNVIANGVPGKLMPAFAQSAGGMLSDQQVDILAKGLVSTWGKPGILDGQNAPPYAAVLHPDTAAGAKAYATYCSRCHGAAGEGNADLKLGSIVQPSYLGLISDQELRNFVIAGAPGMPDWRSDNPGHPMSDDELTGTVAWLGSHRDSTSAAPASTMSASPASQPKPQVSHKATHEAASTKQEPQP